MPTRNLYLLEYVLNYKDGNALPLVSSNRRIKKEATRSSKN